VDLRLPARRALAHLPTPLEPLARIGRRAGLDLFVKRDDLTGLELSGNKVRKLEFLTAEAEAQGATTLLTCGAIGSNHARATAAAARRMGLLPRLLLRAPPPWPGPGDVPDGNLLVDRLLGAEIRFITPAQWADRDALLAAWAAQLRGRGERPYVIPEGGSNALGSLGYAVAVEETLAQAKTLGIEVARIAFACGSAGTAAGIALGCAAAGRADVDAMAVSVCDDRAYFDPRIDAILDEAVERGFASRGVRDAARWRVVDGYKGRGYALATADELEEIAAWAREEGILFDPVYTGKALRGVLAEGRAGRLAPRGATVFVHTGGAFGLFAARGEFPWERL
jgi:D-cysteine desulfhydrase